MAQQNIRYEWIALVRDRWVLVLTIIFVSITLFAVRNGSVKVNDRKSAIEREREKVAMNDEEMRAAIDSLDRQLKAPPKEYWADPRSLENIAWTSPRVVAMDPAPLALISTGQSDLFTHYVKPKVYGEAYTLGFSELSNPVQLLFGSFDLAFVCIYLLPLLVLAFCYNILSAEKESGVLRLTFSQPISAYRWLLDKLLFRFLILSVIAVASITLSLLLFKVDIGGNFISFLKLIFLLLAYILFWFVVAFAVNLMGRSSGSNAVTLVSIWLIIVLLIPSLISQLATTLHPVPSRIEMIHQYRVATTEARKRSDEILKTYYQDHPELIPKDTTQKNQYEWMLGYFASSEVVNDEVRPILKAYDAALANQQEWVGNLRLLSPAILLQNGFNDIAGTSTAHYASFRNQVIDFASEWKDYFKRRMFANDRMKANELGSLPSFQYTSTEDGSSYLLDLGGIIFFLALTCIASWAVYVRGYFKRLLTSN